MFDAAAWDFSGDRVAFRTLGPTPGAVGGETLFYNVATRGSSGWSSSPISVSFTVSDAQLLGTLGLAVDTDFSSWLWGSIDPLVPGGPSKPEMGVYRREPSGEIKLLAAVGEFGTFQYVRLEAVSADLRHAGFNSSKHLLPADSSRVAGRDAYEITDAGLSLAGVDSAGAALSTCGSVWGSGAFAQGTIQHAISVDGRRAFLTSPDPETSECAEPTQVYLREAGNTTAISASRCSRLDCGPEAPAAFAGATRDGGRAYFISSQQLLNEDTDEAADIYRYDVADGVLHRLSSGAGGAGARVVAAAVPAQGERIYFTAGGVFTPGEGEEGGSNLYLWSGGVIRFIATVPDINLARAVLSADGTVIIFSTSAALVPGDTDEAADVYRYDARDGSLQDVSFAGARGNGSFEARIPVAEEQIPGQRSGSLSEDGERVFFETAEQLSPEDENEDVDVYEWAGGTLGLISSGTGEREGVTFAGASGDGRTAYFVTRQSLVWQDTDGGEADLYAARIGGGFPFLPPPPECEGEACREAPPLGVVRPRVATEGHSTGGGGPATKRHFSLAPLSARTRRRLAAGKLVGLVVRVPEAGRVSVLALARLHGLPTSVGRNQAVARRRGRVALRLRLGAPALRQLSARGRLRLQLVFRYSRSRKPLRRELVLRDGS